MFQSELHLHNALQFSDFCISTVQYMNIGCHQLQQHSYLSESGGLFPVKQMAYNEDMTLSSSYKWNIHFRIVNCKTTRFYLFIYSFKSSDIFYYKIFKNCFRFSINTTCSVAVHHLLLEPHQEEIIPPKVFFFKILLWWPISWLNWWILWKLWFPVLTVKPSPCLFHKCSLLPVSPFPLQIILQALLLIKFRWF